MRLQPVVCQAGRRPGDVGPRYGQSTRIMRIAKLSLAKLRKAKVEPSLLACDDETLAKRAFVVSLAAGLCLGALGPKDAELPFHFQLLSSSLGWSYFNVWTLSFYPQILDNMKRQSASGLSLDYLMYSLLGYVCYSMYTCALLFLPEVRESYSYSHAGTAVDVQLSDALFAVHATLITGYMIYQYMQYEKCGLEDMSRMCKVVCAGSGITVLALLAHVAGQSSGSYEITGHEWVNLLSVLGSIKVVMTLVKYTPQAVLNYRRQSTEGWQVGNVLLDLAGGVLSMSQMGIDAFAKREVSVMLGNPAKLGISVISILYDLVFLAQHYVLYRSSWEVPLATQKTYQAQVVKVRSD